MLTLASKSDSDDDNADYDGDIDDCMDRESDSEESDVDDAMLTYLFAEEELDDAMNSRYCSPRVSRKSGLNIFEEDLDPKTEYWTNARRFKNKYRCSRSSLEFITSKIKDHPILTSSCKASADDTSSLHGS